MFRWIGKLFSPQPYVNTVEKLRPRPAEQLRRQDQLRRWREHFPIGKAAHYLGQQGTIVANYIILDNGMEVPFLRIAWITDDGKHEIVAMDGIAAGHLAEAGVVKPPVGAFNTNDMFGGGHK